MSLPKPSPARVAIVGGLTRATHDWERAGTALGLVVEHHDGNTNGARAGALAAVVRRADVVIAIQVKRLSPRTLGAVVPDALAVARTAELAR